MYIDFRHFGLQQHRHSDFSVAHLLGQLHRKQNMGHTEPLRILEQIPHHCEVVPGSVSTQLPKQKDGSAEG